MIKVKSFPIEKADEASKFMVDHPATKNGIQLNMGHIVVFYEDGEVNPNDYIAEFKNKIGEETSKIVSSNFDISRNNKDISKLAPKGYKKSLSDKEIVALLEDEGYKNQEAREKVKAIFSAETRNLQAMVTIENARENIELFKEAIKGLEKII